MILKIWSFLKSIIEPAIISKEVLSMRVLLKTRSSWCFLLSNPNLYLNPEHPAFPPGYNLFVRILAETGIIGFVLFSSWILFILYTCFSLFKLKNKDSIFAMVLFISIIGFIMNWFKTDTIRVFGFWINFALLLILTRKIKYKIDKK